MSTYLLTALPQFFQHVIPSFSVAILTNTHCETFKMGDHVDAEKSEESIACDSKPDGIYADYASDCKKFFVCEKNQIFNFDCPTSTRFYERFESCSFVPPEELKHFVCSTPNQLKDAVTGGRQTLYPESHSLDLDEPHVIDRRNDGTRKGKNIHAIEIQNERDLDNLKQILRENQWIPSLSHTQEGSDDFLLMHPSDISEGNKFHKEKDEEDFHPHPPHQVVPIKGHKYRDQRVFKSMLSPLIESKPTRVSKKLTPCQKAASSRRNDRKSKRFERDIKCAE